MLWGHVLALESVSKWRQMKAIPGTLNFVDKAHSRHRHVHDSMASKAKGKFRNDAQSPESESECGQVPSGGRWGEKWAAILSSLCDVVCEVSTVSAGCETKMGRQKLVEVKWVWILRLGEWEKGPKGDRVTRMQASWGQGIFLPCISLVFAHSTRSINICGMSNLGRNSWLGFINGSIHNIILEINKILFAVFQWNWQHLMPYHLSTTQVPLNANRRAFMPLRPGQNEYQGWIRGVKISLMITSTRWLQVTFPGFALVMMKGLTTATKWVYIDESDVLWEHSSPRGRCWPDSYFSSLRARVSQMLHLTYSLSPFPRVFLVLSLCFLLFFAVFLARLQRVVPSSLWQLPLSFRTLLCWRFLTAVGRYSTYLLEMLHCDDFRAWDLPYPWPSISSTFHDLHSLKAPAPVCSALASTSESRKKGKQQCGVLAKFKLPSYICKTDKALYNLHIKAKFKAKTY